MVDYKVIEDKLFRYRLIFPVKKDENKSFWAEGNIEWFNFLTGGSWGNLIMVAIIAATMVALVLIYRNDVAGLVECCNRAVNCTMDLIPESELMRTIPTFK